jgi:hypothetical protein
MKSSVLDGVWCRETYKAGKLTTNWRTQNKIKNRFYGTLRNMLRFILQKHNKGSASYTQLISKLSPLTLNSLYRGTESKDCDDLDFSFLKGEIKETVK